MILLNKHNLAIVDFASKEDSRYTLKAIKVTERETVATDGWVLARVTLPKAEVDCFPHIEGFHPNGFSPFLLETGTAQKIAKALPSKTTIPVLKHAAVTVDADGKAALAVTDLDSAQVFTQNKFEGQYPAWEKTLEVLPEPVTTIRLNATCLAKLAKLVAGFTDGNNSPVDLTFYGPDKPMKFEAHNGETEQELTGLIMPLKSGD